MKDSKYIAPGIGDFGDRYFGTVKTSQEWIINNLYNYFNASYNKELQENEKPSFL